MRLEAVEALQAVPWAQRVRVSRFIDSLAADPIRVGDYSEKDETDRTVQIKVIGRFAVAYWSDDAVGEVRVVDIVRAGRHDPRQEPSAVIPPAGICAGAAGQPAVLPRPSCWSLAKAGSLAR